MALEAKVDYDSEEDLLYIYSGIKVHDSVEFDQFVIDFSADNKIVGIEFFNASKYLEKFFENPIDRKRLADIKNAKLSMILQKEFVLIKVLMEIPFESGGSTEQIFTAPAPAALVA